MTLAVAAISGYVSLVPGPGGRQPANPVRTPKVAAVRGVRRRFVRPGALRAEGCAEASAMSSARFFLPVPQAPGFPQCR